MIAICEKQLAEYREANKTITEDIENSMLSQFKASFLSFQGTPDISSGISREKCAQPCDEIVVIFRTVPRNQRVFPQYASQSGEVLGVLKQFLVEMNINIAAAEATELEHKKTLDELSDTKIEEIAASNQQHKKKSLKEQETKLSDDRNATSARCRKLLRLLRPSMRMKIRHASTSARRTFPVWFDRHARRIASGVWLEIRAELE